MDEANVIHSRKQFSVATFFPQNLDLNHNVISAIDEDAFRNTAALQNLYISHNLLVALPPIQDLGDTLIDLKVSYNKIEMIPELYFASCATLEYFEITANNLTMINNLSFSGLSSIRQLHVSDNMIEDIVDHFIWNFGSLSHLYLDGNQLSRLPSLDTGRSPRLRRLNVANNKIGDINGSQMLKSPGFRTLNISHTLITELDFLSVLHGLRFLYLEYNIIKQFIDIGNNSLDAWDDLHFPKLEIFRLDNNELADLQRDILLAMPVLIELNLSFNRIEHMPFLSAVGESLEHAYLDHNSINHIDDEHISGLSGLITLQLSYNHVAYLNLHIFANLASLQLFDLRYNKLMTPPILTDINLNPSIEIILTNNSYACDSRLCVLENETLLMEGLLCVTPVSVVGRSVQAVWESLRCGKYPTKAWYAEHKNINESY